MILYIKFCIIIIIMIIKIGGVDVMEQSKFLHNVRRVIGIKGRITIPYHIRMAMKIKYNDVLSFSIGDNPNTIVIEKLNICNHCNATPKEENVIELQKILKGFSREEINKALITFGKADMRGEKNK